MNNETTLNDDNDVENVFEALAVDLLSGLLGAHDNEKNADLKDWLDRPFPVQSDVLLQHAQFICERFQAGDDSHLLMHALMNNLRQCLIQTATDKSQPDLVRSER